LKAVFKTIVITDTLQTTFMILSLVVCMSIILSHLNLSFGEAYLPFSNTSIYHLINTDVNSKTYFLKHCSRGMLFTIAMTGLDQEMMQKNISVDNLKNSKKNMLTFAFTLLFVNLAFLFLWRLLYLFAMKNGAVYSQVRRSRQWAESIKNVFGFKEAGGQIQNIMGDDLSRRVSLQGHFRWHFP
jgi:Na+/proline symporter